MLYKSIHNPRLFCSVVVYYPYSMGMCHLYRKGDIMPVTKKTYPEWVQKYRERGTTIKKKGDSYYLYKRTSKRVPGKKYPQPVDTYLGLITPEGVVRSNKKKVTLTDIEVWEYGFSKAISDLCPEGWKKPLGDEWEDILKLIICDWSPNSYLQITGLKAKEDFRCQFNSQAASLSRRIFKEHKIDVKDLAPLKGVYLVMIGKEKAISKINCEQQELIERLKVEV